MRLPDGTKPGLHLKLDATLRALAGQMSQLMFRFMDGAQQVIDQKLYVAMHYQTVEEYFERRIGFSWRSLRRRLAIHEAVQSLAEDEQDSAREALIELGIHRAAILAPLLKKKPDSWPEWVKIAMRLDEDRLQDRVSKELGLKARGRAAHERDGAHVRSADEKWLDDTLKVLPEDARQEVAEVFAAGMVAHDTPSRFAVFLYMVRSVAVEWYHEAQAKGWSHAEATKPGAGEGAASENAP